MRTIEIDAPSRYGLHVRATVARDPGIARLRAMLAAAPSGLRAIVGSDDALYAWDAFQASHVDVARALGFDDGEFDCLRMVAEGEDPLGDCDEWSLFPDDRVLGGVRLLRGETPWHRRPLRALGFDRAPCAATGTSA